MNTDTQLVVVAPRSALAQKLARAKAVYRQFIQCEGVFTKLRLQICGYGWELGQLLSEMKEEIGHGNWYLFLNANFQELGRTDHTRQKNAERCMTLYRRNENRRNPTDFDDESVRKHMWYYIPVKERVQLQGDRKDAPTAHYLTFINNYWKWRRQTEIGQLPLPSQDVLRRELEATVRDMKQICGTEWVNSL